MLLEDEPHARDVNLEILTGICADLATTGASPACESRFGSSNTGHVFAGR